jgi:hypothetical protein
MAARPESARLTAHDAPLQSVDPEVAGRDPLGDRSGSVPTSS